MPTYDYICDGCQYEFEKMQSIKADAETICPECKEPKLRRKIGAGGGLIFKGSGFYITDYRSDSYKKRAESDTSSSSSSSSSDSGSKSSDSSPKSTDSGSSKSSSDS